MTSSGDTDKLTAEEKAFIDRFATHYAPDLISPAGRAAFDRALEERLARRSSWPVLRPAAAFATALAVLLVVWLAVPNYETPLSTSAEQQVSVAENESLQTRDSNSLLSYAYYTPGFYGEVGEIEEESFLPDDYRALADAFALPGV